MTATDAGKRRFLKARMTAKVSAARASAGVSEGSVNGHRRAPSRMKRPRSAVTSGRELFIDGDPNSAWSRRFHDLVVGHVADLGGADLLSEAQFSLIRRAAAIECELERLDAMLSRGEAADLDEYGRASSHLRRLFETIGLERKQKTINSFGQLLAADQERRRLEDKAKRDQEQRGAST